MNVKEGTRDHVFRHLRNHWLDGKPIVPLLGAGLSVGSAIPVAAHLADYLVKVKCLSDLERWNDCSEYLRFRGWPGRHQLNIDLFAKAAEDRVDLGQKLWDARRWLVTEALRSQIGSHQPTVRGLITKLDHANEKLPRDKLQWMALLQFMTGRRQSLIDSFFDRLVRGRKPSAAHRFLAFLTKLLGWPMVLTTNFDDLIEMAFREEGLSPVVYELVSNGAMPDPHLVASHLAVMKMNGGSFGLRAGFELDEPLDPQSVAFFHSYLPEDAVLLVLGYSGGERRTMTILEALAERFDAPKRIVWVNPAAGCPRTSSRYLEKAVWRLQHSDAGLFLQELYERLAFSHAVAKKPYDALHRLPDVVHRLSQDEAITPPFVRDQRETALRSDLHRAHQRETPVGNGKDDPEETKDSGPQDRIWFNLYELPSLATFLDLLLEELRRHDRSMSPATLSPALDFADFRKANQEAGAQRRQHWYRFLVTALRRYKYLIAIDGVRAFSNLHPAAFLAVAPDRRQALLDDITRRQHARRQEFYAFLTEFSAFLRDAGSLGGSRLLIALDPEDAPHENLNLDSEDAITLFSASPTPLPSPPGDIEAVARRLKKLGHVHFRLAAVAVSFRRPRSRVALVRVTAKTLATEGYRKASRNEKHDRALYRIAGERAAYYSEVEKAIEDLTRLGFLMDQDGGTYCMGTELRNELFDYFVSIDPELMQRLQHFIADYYRVDLYQQSQDLAAYLEYVFHRLASTNLIEPARVETPETWLIASLGREGNLLTGRGYASSVIASLDDFSARCRLVADPGPKKWATDRIESMKVEVWRDLANYEELIRHHMSLAVTQLDEIAPEPAAGAAGRAVDRPKSVNDRIALATTIMELARCANRQSVDQPLHRLELRRLLSRIRKRLGLRKKPLVPLAKFPASLAELAHDIVRQCREIEKADDTEMADVTRKLWPLEILCLRARIDYSTGEVDPWRPLRTRQKILRQSWAELSRYFNQGIDVLRAHGQGERGIEAQTRLRCARARYLYLQGKFSHAHEELNRAEAFAARAQGWDAPVTQAICALHRAEHSILHGLSIEEDDPRRHKRASLFNAANIALVQAENLLLPERRDAFWSCRLFILKAGLGCERLRLLLPARPVPILRDSDMVKMQNTLLSALHAVAAGLANVRENARRRRFLDRLWDELKALHRRMHGSNQTGDPEPSWREYNVRSGLDFYLDERARRRRLDGAQASSAATRPDRKSAAHHRRASRADVRPRSEAA
jgi:hypothetical protein